MTHLKQAYKNNIKSALSKAITNVFLPSIIPLLSIERVLLYTLHMVGEGDQIF
jgi:hypothetical protein